MTLVGKSQLAFSVLNCPNLCFVYKYLDFGIRVYLKHNKLTNVCSLLASLCLWWFCSSSIHKLVDAYYRDLNHMLCYYLLN